MFPRVRRLGPPQEPIRVAIADDASLIFSDDYREGWKSGFEQIGCDVRVFDVHILRKIGGLATSPYRSTTMRGTGKDLANQIIAFRPDLVWCHHGRACSAQEFITRLRQHGAMTAVYLCDEPYEVGETALYSPSFDHVFTMDPCTIETHRKARGNHADRVWYLPAAARTEHFVAKSYADRPVNALFLGNPTLRPRAAWLDPVEREIPRTRILGKPREYRGKQVSIAKGHPDWIGHEQHPLLYSSCVVGLNVHRAPWMDEKCLKTRVQNRPPSKRWPPGSKPPTGIGMHGFGTGFWNDLDLPAGHVNPRFFEMAACGTCVVSDNDRFEMSRLFPNAPRADTPEKYLELVRWFVDHPELAEEVGRECALSILERHTYRHRAAEVLHRTGLRDASHPKSASYLGAPEVWLSTQDWRSLEELPSSALTGLCAPYVPPRGTSSTSMSGAASARS